MYIHVYTGIYMHLYICICHKIIRILSLQEAQQELYSLAMVFPVQLSYLDTSNSQGNYIITFLGLWELNFTGKTKYTSWPTFSLVSKMSEARQASLQASSWKFTVFDSIFMPFIPSPKHSQCIKPFQYLSWPYFLAKFWLFGC